MSALRRLWVRAPLWRAAVFATGAAVAMAIAYPPGRLGSRAPAPPTPGRVVPATADPPSSHAVQAEQPTVAPSNDPSLPAAGATYSGRLPLGAQSVPLPPGRWVALAVNRFDGASATTASAGPPHVDVFLALVLGGRISAAALIGGSTAPDPKDAGFPAPLEAQIPAFYYRRVLSAVDHGAVDFWLCGTTQPGRWKDALRQAAAGVIRQQGLVLGDRYDSAVFRFANDRNWISAEFMFPDATPAAEPIPVWIEAAALADTAPLSQLEKVRRWGKAWHEIMRRGFAGTLQPGDAALIAPP